MDTNAQSAFIVDTKYWRGLDLVKKITLLKILFLWGLTLSKLLSSSDDQSSIAGCYCQHVTSFVIIWWRLLSSCVGHLSPSVTLSSKDRFPKACGLCRWWEEGLKWRRNLERMNEILQFICCLVIVQTKFGSQDLHVFVAEYIVLR